MNFIIYDLEATCWQGRPPRMIQETIEIGALKLDRYGEMKGVFNQFIRPKLNPRLSAYCQELTTIEQSVIDRSDTFELVVEEFQDWIEMDEEEYLLCSWGSFDKWQLINDCKLHSLEYDWLDHHINLKRQYQDIRRLRQPRGLRSAVESEGFEFTGTHHRGIADAENLAKLFTKFLDEWVY